MDLATTLAGKVIEKTLVKCLELAANAAHPLVATRINEARADSKTWTATKLLRDLQYIRTLFSVHRNVSVLNFYYSTSFEDPDAGVIRLESVDQLVRHRNYVISGTAGQGKSVFARYLCLQQARAMTDGRIPFFIELRKIDSSHSFEQALVSQFESIGLVEREFRSRIKNEASLADIMDFIFQSGRCFIVLDGFDEVNSLYRSTLLREVEAFSVAYPSVQLIVTTRPDTEICYSNQFYILPVRPLGLKDLEPFIKLIIEDKGVVERIVFAVGRSEFKVSDVLSTPLMMTLLCVLYLSTERVPKTLIEFYENIFDVLLYRHDVTKAGYKRERFARYPEADLCELFWAICFVSRLEERVSISRDDWKRIVIEALDLTQGVLSARVESKYIKRARSAVGGSRLSDNRLQVSRQFRDIDVDADGLRNEATKNLCLLVEEGQTLSFVHKSVEEFFSAKFVRSSDEAFAEKFYSRVSETGGQAWLGELMFLREIDSKRYARLLWLPEFERFCQRHYMKATRTSDGLSGEVSFIGGVLATVRSILNEVRVGFWMDSKQIEKSFGQVRLDEIDYFQRSPEGRLSSTLLHNVVWEPTFEWLSSGVKRGELTAENLLKGQRSQAFEVIPRAVSTQGHLVEQSDPAVFWISGFDLSCLINGAERTEVFLTDLLKGLFVEFQSFLELMQSEKRKLDIFQRSG